VVASPNGPRGYFVTGPTLTPVTDKTSGHPLKCQMGRRLQCRQRQAIGAFEVLAAVGLVPPAVLDIAPVLVPLAALGLVMIMVGAVITRIRRHEAKFIVGGPSLSRPGRLRGVGPLRPRVLHRLTGVQCLWMPKGRGRFMNTLL
jgi:hypothetical protein